MEEESEILDGEIVGIRFALATPHEIQIASISESPINHATQLSNPFLGLPLEFGKCESCGATEPDKCEGHFGYIQLPVPTYHPAYVNELKQMLSLLCLKCLKIKKAKGTGGGLADRLLGVCCEEASNISIRDKASDGASYLELKLPSRSRLQAGCWNFLERYGYRYGSDYTRPLLAREVKEILRRIPEETRKKLTAKGHIPQEGYILEYLPVPPNCLSVPDVSDGSSSMSVDPSRIELKDVLKKVIAIKSSRSGETNFESHKAEADNMYRAVDTYLQVRGTAKAARSIDMRYGVSKMSDSSSSKAWTEKMRTLFIRKGSGFSSRSVITGDAYRHVNEVGIPVEVAQRITFEEKVSVRNVGYLQGLVDNKLCLSYTQGSTTYSLRDGSKGHTLLKPGQVVHRRVMDGDIVFINRPPTTHKHSLQALQVYVHEDNTVKINPLMCSPLSADFDGDCVHLFYPQSLNARAEVMELFSVDKQLLSSHTGQLILQIGCDALLSLRVMLERMFLDKATAQQLAMYGSLSLPPPAIRKSSKSGPAWSVFQILQLAFPEHLSCKGDRFMVDGSDLLRFDFRDEAMMSIINDIVTSIFKEKGPKETLGFFDSLQPLLMESLFAEGFSVSLEDLSMSRADMNVIHNLIIREISPMVSRLRLSYEDELQLENSLHKVKEVAANFMLKSNSIRNLIDIKSNSALNKLVQQIGFLGLQLSDKKKFYTKTLVEDMALFCKKKYGRISSSGDFGIVKSCFFHGLDPYEEMAHSIAAREVIVRSSRGLAEPGTLFKNLMAVLRDIVITNDGTVRNTCSNSVVQFRYGVDSHGGHRDLFEAGEPVGVLAATAMSTPAYKAVLDSTPNSNSSWELMKEVLLCKVNFQNTANDRRVILYLEECFCGKRFCQENAAFTVRNKLKKVNLKDTAVEFLVEYRKQQTISEIFGIDSCLHGHIHLNKTLLQDWNISMQDILQKCEDVINSHGQKKKKKADEFKKANLSVSECCSFRDPCGSNNSDMPCLMFSYNATDSDLERTLDVLCNTIYPVLLETVIKGDPRISSANVIWNSPDMTTWIRNRHASRRGEWVLDVTVEKSAVKQSGDAWRVVIDSCLSVLHLIDTKRSIPYSIKQVQELLGLSCAFEQAVQRLSASVRMVSKGVLKEHIILLANNMTCSGNMLGFNSGGYKVLTRSLNIKAPFTEATLITPRRCFEKAAEKCHTDSLSTVVGSCSWGKRVQVGTGSQFELLWNQKETGIHNEEETDVYGFLQMVRSTTNADAFVSSPGFDVTEEDMAEWAESPERDATLGELKFEDSDEFQNIHDEGKPSESNWEKSSLWDNSCSGGSDWGVSKSASGVNPQSDWEKTTNVEKEDAWSSGKCKKDALESSKSDSWAAWGPKTNDDANTTPNWETRPAQTDSIVPGNKEPTSDAWGLKSVSETSWDKKKSETESAPAAWGSTDTADWDRKNSETESGADAGGSSWNKKSFGTESGAGAGGSSWNKKSLGTESGAGFGGSSWNKKSSGTESGAGFGGSSWNKESSGTESGAGFGGSSWNKKSSGTESGAGFGGSSWNKKSSGTESGGATWRSRNKANAETESGNATWGSRDKTQSGGAEWSSWKKQNMETESPAWGSQNKKSQTESGAAAWVSGNENNSETEPGGDAAWGSWNKNNSETEPGGDAAWGSGNKNNSESEPGGDAAWGSWNKNNSETEPGGDAWGSFGQPSLTAPDKDTNEDDGNPWVSLKETNNGEKDEKERSQWGNPTKRFPSDGSHGGWSNGGNADWKRNRPPRPPRSEDHLAPMFTATRQRLDLFTSEEQELLLDVDPVMRILRRIMRPISYPDGEPISDDDKTFVLEKILNFHPEKDLKIGSGVDFITVDKHTTFTESRCFFVVSTDGAKRDFSYRKSLNNYLMEKYPKHAEEFIEKYFPKRRPNESQDKISQDATPPPGEEQSQPPMQSIGNGSEEFQTQTQAQSPSQTQTWSPSQTQVQSPSQAQTPMQSIGNGSEEFQTPTQTQAQSPSQTQTWSPSQTQTQAQSPSQAQSPAQT